MKTLKGIFGLIGVCALVLTVLPAANAVTIVDNPLSDSLTVFFQTGLIRASSNAPEATPTFEGPLKTFFVDTDLANPAMFGSPTVFTQGPGGPVSDILGILLDPNGSGHFVIGFVSDDGGLTGDALSAALLLFANPNLPNGGTILTLAETGQPQNVSAYVNPAAGGGPYTATFFSDLDAVP